MELYALMAIIGAIQAVVSQVFGRRGRRTATETAFTLAGCPLITKGQYTWTETRTVVETFPFKGSRNATVECTATSFFLCRFLVIWTDPQAEVEKCVMYTGTASKKAG